MRNSTLTLKTHILLCAVMSVALLATSCKTRQMTTNGSAPVSTQKVNMILDADFGSSTDDLFALMMLHHYIDDGTVDLRAIIVDREGDKNAQLVDALNNYYGHPDIPIGLERNGVKNPRCFIPYSGIVDLADKYGNALFKGTQDVKNIPDGYKLYRQTLSQAADKSIVVVAIGFATTLAQLFESQPDEYSKLNGLDLFERKVKAVYIQAGRFESGDSLSGYNMRAASKYSAVFYDKLPKSVDLILSPSNIGDAMNYAPADVLIDLSNTIIDPIKAVYTYYTCDTGQRMWDVNCVVNAVLGDEQYNLSPRGWVTFVDKGEESLMLFKKDPHGNARYQLPGDSYFAQEKIMDIRKHTRQVRDTAQYTIEAPQPQLIRHEALLWAEQRQQQLTDKYLATAGNKLDPDEIRMLFRPLGYTGPNWKDYQEAEHHMTKVIYNAMLDKALRNGKQDLVIVTGTAASGKTTAAKTLNFKKAGLIYDAAISDKDQLQAIIDIATAKGIKKITIVPVYNDLLTCYKNSINRGWKSWRFTALDQLVEEFRANKGLVHHIAATMPHIKIIPVNCSQNQGVKTVSIEEAGNWHYDITDEEMSSVLNYLSQLLENGDIEAGSVRAAAGEVTKIKGLSDDNKRLAQHIENLVQKIEYEHKLRY